MPNGQNKLASLSIFFPAYNEEANIADTIKQADQMAQSVTNTYEIIIVNDGSKDQTGQVTQETITQFPNARLITHEQNKGYGEALLTGLRNAQYEWVFFSDSDLQFDLNQIHDLIPFTNNHDVVIGYRAPRQDPFMRKVNAWGWKMLNRSMFGLKVKDIDCAYKLFKKTALDPVLPDMQSGGAMISAELLIRLTRNGAKVKEVPVRHFPRKAGSPTGAKPSVILRAFKELWHVYTTL